MRELRCASMLIFLLTAPMLSDAFGQGRGFDGPRAELREVVTAGRAQPVVRAPDSAGPHEIPYLSLRIARADFPIELDIGSAGSPPAVRITTQLEGREAEWQDHDSAMWLVLRFLDESNRPASSASFLRRGTSAGWMGLPQGSRFQHTIETAVAPGFARKLQLLFVSGGTPRTTGFWAVRRLRIFGARAPGEDHTEIFSLDQLRGSNLETAGGSPEGWNRDGTGLNIPQIYTNRDGGEAEPMLALVDALPFNTGGWLLDAREAIPVSPGMQLRFECEEIYSIGRGGDARVTYRTLPIGNYVFRVRSADEFGRPAGPELRLPIQVVPPFYATAWFRSLAVLAALAALAALVRYITWHKLQRKVRRLEAQRAIDEERTRLARDIHDEMGARLTQISILARRLASSSEAANGAHEAARQLQSASRELVTALDEIVWAANPKLDTLESLGNYLSQYAGRVVREAGLRCRLDIPTLLPEQNLSSGTRHRVMMAAKEAITNALKHAQATEIRVRLAVTKEHLVVVIQDNGIGFDPSAVHSRNGLENLRRRLEEMGGTCELHSVRGEGTSVTLRLPAPGQEGES